MKDVHSLIVGEDPDDMVTFPCCVCGQSMYVPFETAQRMAEDGSNNEPLCMDCSQLSESEIIKRKRRLQKQK
jgi:hypothetical protein